MGLNGIVDECQRTKKDASAAHDPEREGPNAEVAIHDQKLSRLDRHLIEQRPFLAYERSPPEIRSRTRPLIGS